MKMTNPSRIVREYLETGRSESCPIIDMHGHLGPFHGAYLPSAPPDRMVTSLKRQNVLKLVCAPHQALFADVQRGNVVMQEAIDRYPETLLGYWSVNPNHPDLVRSAPRELEKSHGFVGFKFLPEYHEYPVTGAGYAPVLEYADEHGGLIVLVHTWGGSSFDDPSLLAEIAGKYPRVTFLMGHSGFGAWETSFRVARDHPNTYLDLTCVYAAHDFGNLPRGNTAGAAIRSTMQINGNIERMVRVAGSGKIVFGTDMPWYSPHAAAGAILFSRIDDDARHDIMHRNAERLIGRFLTEPHPPGGRRHG